MLDVQVMFNHRNWSTAFNAIISSLWNYWRGSVEWKTLTGSVCKWFEFRYCQVAMKETFMVWRYQNLFNIQNNRLLEDRIFIFFSLRYYWLKNLFDKLDYTRTKKLGVEILTNTNSFFCFVLLKSTKYDLNHFQTWPSIHNPPELDFLEHFLRRNIMYNRLMA